MSRTQRTVLALFLAAAAVWTLILVDVEGQQWLVWLLRLARRMWP